MTENLAGRGEGLAELVARHDPQLYSPQGSISGVNGTYTIAFVGCSCGWNSSGEASKAEKWSEHVVRALEAAAPAGTAQDVHWAIKADCARCRESYPQRHDKPDYIPNFGNVEAGDWTHPTTAEHDWRYCQAAKIHEALFAAALATPSPQAPARAYCDQECTIERHTPACQKRLNELWREAGWQEGSTAATQEQAAGSKRCDECEWHGCAGREHGCGCKCHVMEMIAGQAKLEGVEPGSPRKVGEDGPTRLPEYWSRPAECGIAGHFWWQMNGSSCLMCQREARLVSDALAVQPTSEAQGR